MKHNKKYYALDLLRGLAAILVALGHTRALILQTSGDSNLDILGKGLYFISGFGYQAVMLFFVLSGFFITKSINQSFESNAWSIPKYAINRLTRLWVVLIPALLITALFDFIGLQHFNYAPFYTGALEHMDLIDVKSQFTSTAFVGNIFFQQTLLTSTFGSNGPLWSLSYEFWYYVLIALIFIILDSSHKCNF